MIEIKMKQRLMIMIELGIHVPVRDVKGRGDRNKCRDSRGERWPRKLQFADG